MKLLVFGVTVCFVWVFGNKLYASEGKELFKSKCVSCHSSAEVSKPIQPVDKVSFQWKHFFKRKKHKRRYKINLKDKMTKGEQKQILNYLVNHASDSDLPEIIGER